MVEEITDVVPSKIIASTEVLLHVSSGTYFIPDAMFSSFAQSNPDKKCFSHYEVLKIRDDGLTADDIKSILKSRVCLQGQNYTCPACHADKILWYNNYEEEFIL